MAIAIPVGRLHRYACRRLFSSRAAHVSSARRASHQYASLAECAAAAAAHPGSSAPALQHHVSVCISASRLQATDPTLARALFFSSAEAWLCGGAGERVGTDAAALCQSAAHLRLSADEASTFFPRLLAATAHLSSCPSFTARDAAGVLWAAAAAGVSGGAAALPALYGAVERLAPHFSPRHASLALWAAGRLSRTDGGGGGPRAPPPAGALGALSAAAARTAAAFGPLDAAHAAWGAARLQITNGKVLCPLFSAVARNAPALDQEQVIVAWGAAARLQLCGGARVLEPLAAAVARAAPSLTPPQVVDALAAAATLSAGRWNAAQKAGDATGELLAAAGACAHALPLRGAARCLWAAAALRGGGVGAARPLAEVAAAALLAPGAPPPPGDVAAALLTAAHLGAPLPAPALDVASAALRLSAAPQVALAGAEAEEGRRALAAALDRLGWLRGEGGGGAEGWAPALGGLLLVPLVAQCPASARRVAVEFLSPSQCMLPLKPLLGGRTVPLRRSTHVRLALLALPAAELAVAPVHWEAWARCGGNAAREDALLRAALARALEDGAEKKG
jgi:hypothetical protein